jgi:hypothetical protein
MFTPAITASSVSPPARITSTALLTAVTPFALDTEMGGVPRCAAAAGRDSCRLSTRAASTRDGDAASAATLTPAAASLKNLRRLLLVFIR